MDLILNLKYRPAHIPMWMLTEQIVIHLGICTSTHTIALCLCREMAKMSSYVHGCLLSTPLSLFHSNTWWWQRAQRRETPQEHRGNKKSTHPPSQHGPSCLPVNPILGCLISLWIDDVGGPCQSLRDFRCSAKAKVHNEWKTPSQTDFKLNQTPVFNYLPDFPLRNFRTCTERKGEKERKWWGQKKAVRAECKWLQPCMVSEQVAQW